MNILEELSLAKNLNFSLSDFIRAKFEYAKSLTEIKNPYLSPREKKRIDKKQYEAEEFRLLSERVRWTDRLRQSTGRGDWFIKWRITETKDSLCRVRNRLIFLSTPNKKSNNIDISLVKSVPISNLYDILPSGFFVNNPLRQEKSPSNSLHWNKKNNTWKDFGSGDGGDNISLVMKDKKCNFREACEFIIKFI